MNNQILESLFACPRCKKDLKPKTEQGNCQQCKFAYTKSDGIWHLAHTQNNISRDSLDIYDRMHENEFGGPNDGSYEILASIAKGNKTLDIACGEGLLEKLAPETVGADFSLNALKKAKKNNAKYLVLADAQALPFQDNAFDVAISAGSLEHFQNPQKAILEMARVSKIQVLTVHKSLPIPFASFLFGLVSNILRIKHQPIEKPIDQKTLEKMIEKVNLHIVFKGVWTIPFNRGRVIKVLPELKKIPSCLFLISIRKDAIHAQ